MILNRKADVADAFHNFGVSFCESRISIALITLDVMHRVFEETCSSALGRTRIRSLPGSMTALLISSASCVVAILESPAE